MTLLTRRATGRCSSSYQHAYAEIDIHESETGFVAEIPVPGFSADNVEVTLENNVLSVAAQNDRRKISRSLVIPETIDGERINATVENGLVTIDLPFHPRTAPRKIEIRQRDTGTDAGT